jgi:ABC-type transport system substrate-binding protein
MPSTRRSESIAGLAGLGILAAVIAATIALLPPIPEGPRWMGAGADEPRRGGTFVGHTEGDVRSLDPQIAFDAVSGQPIKLLFEGLLDYEGDGDDLHLVPRLAEALPELSDDGLVYRFRLRRGVRFSDSVVFCPQPRQATSPCPGRELVADDVRWSLEHMLDPDTGSPGITFFELIDGLEAFREGDASHISGIRIIDRRTVEIRLRRADQTFLFAMAMTFAYPVAREAYAFYGAEVARHPVGTGAFVLESWEPGVQLDFVRNPDFFLEGRPYLDRIVYQLNLDRRPAVMRFRNGELDHIHRQTPADYLQLMSEDAWAPYRVETPLINVWGLEMNCELEPFTNVHMRRAVAFALNGERWNRARANRLVLTGQPVPERLPGFDPDLPGLHHYDPELARRELALAFPDGYHETLTLWMMSGDVGRLYGELIQQDLREIGVAVEIREVAWPILLQQTGTRRTAQMHLGGWTMDYPDASNFLDILFHSRSIHEHDSENKSFYSNPEVDRLLDEARIEIDRARRLELYRQASAIIVADAPWRFVFSETSLEVWQPYVRNYRPHPVWSSLYRDVWLDLPRHRIATGPSLRPMRNVPALAPFGRLDVPGLGGAR